ncbi:MAG: hypothetical protein ACE5L6_02060 [Candidatus Bathyarchaeia archaeon]
METGKALKPQTVLDVEILVGEKITGKIRDAYLTFHKAKGKRVCYVKIKPGKRMPKEAWLRVMKLAKQYGGRWDQNNRLWEVPLERKS